MSLDRFPSFVIADNNDVIALNHVECINLSREESDSVFDKLSDDKKFYIRTVSGVEYIISANINRLYVEDQFIIPKDNKEFVDKIFVKWGIMNSGINGG